MIVNILKILALVFVLMVGVALMLPSVTRGREAARRTQCKNNLKFILLALHNYHDAYGGFPPAYTTDGDGRPLHSWRTLLLPFLDQQPLYDSIDLSKPWNDPANAVARKTTVGAYRCPSVDWHALKSKDSAGLTTYLAIVTPESCLRPSEPRTLKEITDGSSNTIMITEVAPHQAVHWMQPIDADEQTILTFRGSAKNAHTGGGHVGLADGTVRFVSINAEMQTVRALVTIAADDKVGDF